jgi:succinoglycan biosynthesis protein ExoV
VFSSGAGYSPPPPGLGEPRWQVTCVRGPLTAAALDLPPDAAVTDGAYLLAALPEFTPLPEAARNGTIFIPHHRALEAGYWRRAAERAGIGFVSPRQDSRQVIARIRASRLVIADSMHAAIVADSLRVPWVAVRSSAEISTFKWLDWTLSMELPYEPLDLPPSTVLKSARNLLLPLYGKKLALKQPSAQAALRHYRAMVRFKRSALAPLLRDATHGVLYKRLLQPGRGLPGLKPLLDRADERRAEQAAKALARAAAQHGLLSAESIFRARLAELQYRLAKIGRELTPAQPAP